MIITASLSNVAGCIGCLVFAGLSFYLFKLTARVVKLQKMPNDSLGNTLIAGSLLSAIGFFLVPVGFILMAALERNPQLLDLVR